MGHRMVIDCRKPGRCREAKAGRYQKEPGVQEAAPPAEIGSRRVVWWAAV